MLGLQTLVITAGTLKLMPLTGVTLPFVSYGGSSLITSFLMVGLLLAIARSQPAGQLSLAARRTRPYMRLARALLGAFLVVAGGLILWQVVLAPFLIWRDDNPRRIIAEQKIDRGRLLTRAGIPIAETIIGADGLADRHYPYPSLSSVTGYYSIRHGVGGTEAAFDSVLRGTIIRTAEEKMLDELLHRPLVGRDVTLTIDLPAQVAADVALGGEEGAVVVIDLESGAIVVMSSRPTFDPNTLDEKWASLRQDQRAPLLNRASQGLFPVGDLARLIGLIGLYESGATLPDDPLQAPLAETLAPLGRTGYVATAHQLGLLHTLPGLPSQPGRLPNFDDRGTVRDLVVTPLHLARVVGGLEREGSLPQPILSLASDSAQMQAIRPDTARAVRRLLPQVDEHIVGLSGQATPEETGQASLSWFVGLAPANAVETEMRPSAALSAEGLVLDPTEIDLARPTPTPAMASDRARYAVVAVVVTDVPHQGNLAVPIALAPLKVLLEQN
jgi:hypothetical protein